MHYNPTSSFKVFTKSKLRSEQQGPNTLSQCLWATEPLLHCSQYPYSPSEPADSLVSRLQSCMLVENHPAGSKPFANGVLYLWPARPALTKRHGNLGNAVGRVLAVEAAATIVLGVSAFPPCEGQSRTGVPDELPCHTRVRVG